MTAALYDEVPVSPVRNLRLVRDTSPAPGKAAKKAAPGIGSQLFRAGGDPLVDGAARLLTVPLRHVYAALWRAGILEVQA